MIGKLKKVLKDAWESESMKTHIYITYGLATLATVTVLTQLEPYSENKEYIQPAKSPYERSEPLVYKKM